MKTQNSFSGRKEAAWQKAIDIFGPELVFESALEQILEDYIASLNNETRLVQEMPFPQPCFLKTVKKDC